MTRKNNKRKGEKEDGEKVMEKDENLKKRQVKGEMGEGGDLLLTTWEDLIIGRFVGMNVRRERE